MTPASVTSSVQHTFLFADLAGYTALTEAHGDEAAAEIVAGFISSVRDLLADHGAEQIKTIGDEVMARVDDPEQAVILGLRIVKELAAHAAPPVRVGMHTGTAVERDGDWYGACVNLAARVTAAAKAGEVLVTESTKRALSSEASSELRPRGERWFKNVPEPVSIYAAHDESAGREFSIDPVCRMAVDPSKSAAETRYRGSVYCFCSAECKEAFVADPKRHVARSHRARWARRVFLNHLRVFAVVQIAIVAIWTISVALGGPAFPWFAFVLVGWGMPLLFHFRTVRSVL
jgi:adenylate cyclase